jgi:receptor protein-tyrosine kinase
MDIIEKAISKLNHDSTAPSSVSTKKNIVEKTTHSLPKSLNKENVVPLPRELTFSTSPLGNVVRLNRRAVNIDNQRLRQAGMLVPNSSRSRIKEEYRHIKRPLLQKASNINFDKNEYANLIMVTSAVPGEGKTFTAINLALSIASERDRTVLLVDSDMLRASLSDFFNVHPGLGLVDFLVQGTIPLSEVLVSTDIPSLTLLPAGNTHHLSTELLSSMNMKIFTQELSKRYADRVIIFDSPPLLHTTESRVLSHLMGQIVVVIEAEKTSQAQVGEALSLLEDLNEATSVGIVLNKTRRKAGYYEDYNYSID